MNLDQEGDEEVPNFYSIRGFSSSVLACAFFASVKTKLN
jgi:hypothetical protein